MRILRLEKMLRDLEPCGVRLAPGVVPEDLAGLLDEISDYEDLLTVLGEETDDSRGYLSDDLWHFDAECIAGGEDYVAIAERFRTLARGELPLVDIRARADPEEAWIAFRLDGAEYRWELQWEDDWVDPEIIEKLGMLLYSRGSQRRFTMFAQGGQDCLIGCSTAQELSRLRMLTGLQFRWLSQDEPLPLKPGQNSPRSQAVSDQVLACAHPTDWVGAAFKFACGAVIGFIVGFLLSVRFLRNAWTVPRAIGFGLIGAAIAGVLALRT